MKVSGEHVNKRNVDSMGDWQRSCRCGEPRESEVGHELTLMGWTQSLRDHGGLLFIDLRDRTGVVQVVVNPEVTPEAHEKAKRVRSEDVLAVCGSLVRRSEETVNPNLATGTVELMAQELRVLNPSRVPPFPVDDDVEPTETSRFRYRYLDLRRPRSLRPLEIRHRMLATIRNHLDGLSFMEVETPDPHQKHAGGCPGLSGPQPGAPRQVLRPAAVAPALQADPYGGRGGPVLSGGALLSR